METFKNQPSRKIIHQLINGLDNKNNRCSKKRTQTCKENGSERNTRKNKQIQGEFRT